MYEDIKEIINEPELVSTCRGKNIELVSDSAIKEEKHKNCTVHKMDTKYLCYS